MERNDMIKRFAAVCIAAASTIAFAEDVTVPSTEVEPGVWVGDVDFLTNALKNAAANQTIYLSKGVYDLSPVTNAPMFKADGSAPGAALIFLGKSGMRLVGKTGDPKDVVIKAVDSQYRILAIDVSNAGVYNVTIAGGNATSAHISTWGWRRGGGVVLSGSGTVASNCIFTANKADAGGGAVLGHKDSRTGTVYDSVFYGNDETTDGALAAHRTTIRNCTFTNNIYTKCASENYGISITDNCLVYDSYFAHNRGTRTGGVSEGMAVNCKFFFNTQNNIVKNNYGNPGGGGAYNAALTNCTFYGNVAYRLGGAIRGGQVVNCTVISNRVLNLDDSNGGGIVKSSLVEGCTVMSNLCRNGGGVFECALVRNTDILYNKAGQEGGGAHSSVLENCLVAHNVAIKYANGCGGGYGGGMSGGAATNCVFRDNRASSVYGASCLKNCDISGTCVFASRIEDCVFHEMDNREMYRAIGNVGYPNGILSSNIFMIGGAYLVRNCLFTNCNWRSVNGDFVNSSVFERGRDAITSKVECCTFADNHYYWFVRGYGSSARQISFVNTIFTGNRDTTGKGDINTYESGYSVFSNCVYGVMGPCTAKAAGFENYGCTSITARAAYKFTGKEPNPYSLRRSSPLRGWGMVLDWMTDATDLAGNPRLRDGAVDVGCYQCWLDPVGMMFSIR